MKIHLSYFQESKRIFVTAMLSLIMINSYSQELSKVKIKEPNPVGTKEIYQVLKSKPEIKHGTYKLYKNKKLIELGFFKNNEKDSLWEIYSQNGHLIASGYYSLGKKIGVWNFYLVNGELVQKYNYDSKKLIFYDQAKENALYGTGPKAFPDTSEDKMPIFIGGMSYMNTIIQNTESYPKEAWLARKTATVYISFVVEADGKIAEVKSLRYVGYGFDEAGIKVVAAMNDCWIPGIQDGVPNRVQFNLPIHFSIK